jgi:thiol:disulfide interchange protein DsbD
MKNIFTIAFLFFVFSVHAQVENPIQWTFTAQKTGDKQFDVHLTATLQNKWHVYAQDAGEGPVPTLITFAPNPLVQLDGIVKETGKLESVFDKNFNSTLRFYSNKVDFVQKVKIKSSASTVLKGTISYMVCNDRKCLPPKEIPFSVKITSK